MPCYTEPHSYCKHSKGECSERGSESLVKFYNEKLLILIDQIEYYKNQSDITTSFLCEICNHLEQAAPQYLEAFKPLNAWWIKHKKFDEERKEKDL